MTMINITKATAAIALWALIFWTACSPADQDTTVEQALPELNAEKTEQHIAVLASDDFMGRMPFTEGETKTLDYLTTQLAEIGVKPGNQGSYFQEVPLVEITPDHDETLTIHGPSGPIELTMGRDFVATSLRMQEEMNIVDSEIVFCGYGIVAPEYGWNDYEGIDMTGKTALVMVNDPGFGTKDSTLFNGESMTYYGRWTYKYEEAARQGAAGVIIIHETNAAGYPWFVVQSSWSGKSLTLKAENRNMDRCKFQGWINLSVAAEIFKASTDEEKRFFERAKSPDFKPVPLGVTYSYTLRNSMKEDVSQNVIGLIEGSTYPDEYIIYSAHWDHLGIAAPVQGDSIYNGAYDNASGTAALLSIAEGFLSMDQKPERSVVFLFVTAEEQGLLGSAWYAAHPVFPARQTVANLNIDMIGFVGKTRDLTVVGYGQSELDRYASEAADWQGRYILPDQEPEKGFYYRSDHFNFAKIGIPALFATGTHDHWEHGIEYADSVRTAFTTLHYHRPSDEYDPETFDMEGIMQDAHLYFYIGHQLANNRDWPQWSANSEFRAVRKADGR